MRICLSCRDTNRTNVEACPTCGVAPSRIDGFLAFAPDLAYGGANFDKVFFDELVRVEQKSFWFKTRNQLIVWALQKFVPTFNSLLEIGCGTGFVLTAIGKKFPDRACSGSEVFLDGLKHAAKRVPSAALYQMDGRDIPFESEFDVICAFDVLEHISEDSKTLQSINRALTPTGVLLVTVPQHDWLWSPADDHAGHVRRYETSDLIRKIRDEGFEIIRTSSFVSLLLPLMLASRVLRKSQSAEDFDPTAELRLPRILNFAFYAISRLELLMIKLGLDFPIGGSRFVVARKARLVGQDV